MIKVDADFNNVTSDGRLKAVVSPTTAAGLAEGEQVVVWDRLESILLRADIASVEPATGAVTLRVDWSQLDHPEVNGITGVSSGVVLSGLAGGEFARLAVNAKRSSFAITA